MKNGAAVGGLAGFLLVVCAGLFAGRDSGQVLLEASLAAVLGTMMLRWLNRILLRGVHAALIAQAQHRQPVNATEEAANPGTSNT